MACAPTPSRQAHHDETAPHVVLSMMTRGCSPHASSSETGPLPENGEPWRGPQGASGDPAPLASAQTHCMQNTSAAHQRMGAHTTRTRRTETTPHTYMHTYRTCNAEGWAWREPDCRHQGRNKLVSSKLHGLSQSAFLPRSPHLPAKPASEPRAHKPVRTGFWSAHRAHRSAPLGRQGPQRYTEAPWWLLGPTVPQQGAPHPPVPT